MEAINFIAEILPPLALVLSFAYICVLLYGSQKPQNYPPGPWGLPILGNLPQLGSSPHITLTELSKVYGDVFSVKFGLRETVVLNSEGVVREALLKNSRQFSNRPPMFAARNVRKTSISFGEYCPAQIIKKRCALRAIHQVAFNNVGYINKIVQKVFLEFKEGLVKKAVKTFQPSVELKLAVIKIMFNFTFGENRCNDQLTDELQKLVVESSEFTESSAACSLVDFIPWVKPFIRKQVAIVEHSIEALMKFVEKAYTTRRKEAVDDSCIALCTAKLWEKAKNKYYEETKMDLDLERQRNLSNSSPKDNPLNNDNEEIVKMLSADVFGAGLETVSNALCWAMAYVVNNPKIQQSLHRELDSAVGRHRLPTIEDKPNMPLLQATVLEVLRISSVLPLALPHQTSAETTLGGYTIPKDTLVVINLWAVNHDPRVFEDPHVFNPYRFLNENEEVCEIKSKFQLPFSIGSRRCLGSTLAKAEIFLLLACLLQHFEFSSAKPGDIDLEGHFGLALRPKSYSVRAHLRRRKVGPHEAITVF